MDNNFDANKYIIDRFGIAKYERMCKDEIQVTKYEEINSLLTIAILLDKQNHFHYLISECNNFVLYQEPFVVAYVNDNIEYIQTLIKYSNTNDIQLFFSDTNKFDKYYNIFITKEKYELLMSHNLITSNMSLSTYIYYLRENDTKTAAYIMSFNNFVLNIKQHIFFGVNSDTLNYIVEKHPDQLSKVLKNMYNDSEDFIDTNMENIEKILPFRHHINNNQYINLHIEKIKKYLELLGQL